MHATTDVRRVSLIWASHTVLCDHLQGGLLVEYDIATRAPVGLVCKVPPGA